MLATCQSHVVVKSSFSSEASAHALDCVMPIDRDNGSQNTLNP
jgi:hypothetical protein